MARTTSLNKIEATLYEPTFYKVIQGGMCFVAGTEVLMADGSYRPIEKLKSKDKVLSRGVNGGIIITEVKEAWYSSNSKPVIEISVGGERIKATYDHKFYSAGEYKELYKIVWGKMEASQRIQLQLLCEQYGAHIDIDGSWKKEQSNYHEAITRLRLPATKNWIYEDSNGQKKYQGASDSSTDMGSKPKKEAFCQSQERRQDRQSSGQSRMGDECRKSTPCVQNNPSRKNSWRKTRAIKVDCKTSNGIKKSMGCEREQVISQRICTKIQSQGVDNQRCSREPKLEMVTIDEVWVQKPEKVYSLSIDHPSHNYFVSRKNINVSNSAGKTFAIITLLIGYCHSYPDSLVTVVGLSYPHLEAGSIRDFVKIMKEVNIWDEERWNKSSKTYQFENGSLLEFKSIDRMSARGPRRDVLFVNEANGITYEVFQELAGRTKDFVIVDFNPSSKFWAHERLVEGLASDTTYITLTYLDNEALSAREVANIESHKPKQGENPSNWWTVYGLGQIGTLEGNVYSGWSHETFDHIRQAGKLVRYGLDFGFSNDESAMVAVYEMDDGKLGLAEKLYRKGLLGSQYGEVLRSIDIDPNVLIVADSARPEIIAEIQKAGFRCIGADKNPGSVLRGIDRVSQRQIVSCGDNLKREYLSYAWRKKRSGEILDEPEDGNDHLMDAVRYAVDDLSRKRFDF